MSEIVFVFGTLKQGFRNAHVNQGQRLPGRWCTRQPHPLLIAGPRCLPWLLQRPGQGLPVIGEVYSVDTATLQRMDALERIDTPGWYERRRIEVQGMDGSTAALQPWVYFGSEAGFSGLQVHLGPIGEYLLEHQSQYPPEAEG